MSLIAQANIITRLRAGESSHALIARVETTTIAQAIVVHFEERVLESFVR